jgi:hypothetical protein
MHYTFSIRWEWPGGFGAHHIMNLQATFSFSRRRLETIVAHMGYKPLEPMAYHGFADEPAVIEGEDYDIMRLIGALAEQGEGGLRMVCPIA